MAVDGTDIDGDRDVSTLSDLSLDAYTELNSQEPGIGFEKICLSLRCLLWVIHKGTVIED